MNKKIFYILLGFLLILSASNAQSLTQSSKKNMMDITGEKYVTGEDGVVRIYINIWGHVQSPGTYLIYDGASLINALSLAGGPMDGANLKDVQLLSMDSKMKSYNLKSLISSSSKDLNQIILKPYDTIIIKESTGNKILVRSGLVGALLQLVNVLYTIENLKN